ncbi:MAG: hemerythrin domain-containing protein [Gammaproteobacteria bacterium]|nr:hemerythrin domain-containing protein [Gammaproteobacteria bacterium]
MHTAHLEVVPTGYRADDAPSAVGADFYAVHERRLDLYRPIHKALRAMMSDTLAHAGRIDCADGASVAGVAARIRALLDACHAHIDKEDRYIHRAMEARCPGSTVGIAAEHAAHEAAIANLEARVGELEAASGDERIIAARRIHHDLSLFVAENFQHMVVEETVNNAVLWKHYDDAELASLHEAIVASIPPSESATLMRWMIPALAPDERAGLLLAVRAGAPAQAFEGLLTLADELLGDADRAKLTAALAA